MTSGQVSGQLSHQQKHGWIFQSQCKRCGSFSWQQPSQSQHVSQPQPLLHVAQPEEAALQVPLSVAAGAGAAAAGLVGAGAAGCAL